MIYADYAATTPLRPEARAELLRCLDTAWGNPSSPHAAGQEAAGLLAEAREKVGAALGCHAREVYFCSCGSESDNQALETIAQAGEASGRRHIVSSSFEHPAVARFLEHLADRGFEISLVDPEPDGRIDEARLRAAMRPDTCGLSIMHANNEIGVIQPVADFAALAHEFGALFHTDAVQTAGHLPIGFSRDSIDLLSASAHKFGGPKGAGILLARRGLEPARIVFGGGQERGSRAGTQDVAAASAAAVAIEVSCRHMNEEMLLSARRMRRLLEGVSGLGGLRVLVGEPYRLPHLLGLCFEGVDRETLVMLLDQAGVCVSAGSACSSGVLEKSRTLAALGLSGDEARGFLRISFGWATTDAEVDEAAHAIVASVSRLRERAA